MLFYILAMISCPILSLTLINRQEYGRFPVWLCITISAMWVVSFMAMFKVTCVLYPLQDMIGANLLISLIMSTVIFTGTLFVTMKQRKAFEKDTKEAVFQAVKAEKKERADRDAKQAAMLTEKVPSLRRLASYAEAADSLYLGEIKIVDGTPAELLAQLPDRGDDDTKVAYSHGVDVFIYINKKWCYAHADDFITNGNPHVSNPERNFWVFDTSSLGPEYVDLVNALCNRAEIPDAGDIPLEYRQRFFGELALGEAISRIKSEIDALSKELETATNSDVIKRFNEIKDLPNTNYKARCIRWEASDRSRLIQCDLDTAAPFDNYSLIATGKA